MLSGVEALFRFGIGLFGLTLALAHWRQIPPCGRNDAGVIIKKDRCRLRRQPEFITNQF